MRHQLFILMLFVLAFSAKGQEQTLFKGDIERGGFGAPVVKFTAINQQSALMLGGRGGWIINHSLALGGGGYAVVNEVNAPQGALPLEGPLDIEFSYGGFELEYVIHPNSLWHYSLYTLLGGGAANYVKDEGPVAESNEQAGETDFMWVLEPAVCAELNVTKWFHLNGGVSYRIVSGVGQEKLKEGDFNGFTATLTFKFGNF